MLRSYEIVYIWLGFRPVASVVVFSNYEIFPDKPSNKRRKQKK